MVELVKDVKCTVGSVNNIGDRVYYVFEEWDGSEQRIRGEVVGIIDEQTARVKVVLPGRRKKGIIDFQEIPISKLIPDVPNFNEESESI